MLSWINSEREHNAGINTECSEQGSCTGMCGIQQALKQPGEEEGAVRWQTLQAVQNYLGQPNPKRDQEDLPENVRMSDEKVRKAEKAFNAKHLLNAVSSGEKDRCLGKRVN